MSKLPSKVVLGNRSFSIAKVTDGSMGDDLGQLLYTIGRINLSSYQSPDCLADTLLHELIHAVDFTYGASGNHLTEDQVVRLTGGLLTILSEPRNAKVFNFIFNNDKE
jgi:hypothetical protein